ncbi:uncharacterized protein LOC125661864 isoform X2 [Ostrea edulis]|uniref:uncharacterized protein LOC125661864 isoform X2 n=1 Tax=Ostrea edulis TaxID=37623 RepID=UPI0024AF9942|nr:uncharacterized protein LOC125661864 isoform X2 [Ostrea edulis]
MSDVKTSWNRIKEHVGSTPTMVFSVIGDSDSFVPRPWAKTVFQTALIEAAKSGGESWILYRGHKNGVSDIIRDAYRNYGDMEFGTGNVNKPDEDTQIHYTDIKKPLTDVERHVKLISIAGKQPIYDASSPLHTEASGAGEDFLLKFEKFVSEREVSFFSQKMDFKMPVPIAIIVCEGDIKTIAHISDALEMKLPVIIIKGSGKAADLILDYLENSEMRRKKASLVFGIRFDDNTYEKLEMYLDTIEKKKDLIGVFDVDNDDPLMLSNIVGEAVVSCWAIENILTEKIQHLQSPSIETRPKTAFPNPKANGLVMAGSSVAWKLVKRNSVQPEQKKMMQLLGDYKKESRAYVLNPKFASPTSLPLYFYFGYQLLQESNLLMRSGRILLLEALKANRCDYVRVLLDHGVKLKHKDLPELYDETVSCEECKFKEKDCLHMQWILKQIQEDHAKKLCHKYRSVMKKLKKAKEEEKDNEEQEKAKKKVKKYRKKMRKIHNSVAEAAKGLCRKSLRYKGTDKKSKNEPKAEQTVTITTVSETEETDEEADEETDEETDKENDDSKKNIIGKADVYISDLLLWAIFANRRELAEICWLRSEDHLLTGLVCSALLQKLANKANNVKEQVLSSDLEEHSKLFEQRCIAIMDRMYEENTKHAIDLMDDEAVVWGIESSPLTFAYENFMYDVVAHTCSQKNMNKQWYNNLAPDFVPFLKSAFRRPKKFFTAPLTKYIYNYIMFLSMLVMYSAFVLTSISTEYYVQDIARIFEYYVYFWGAGDFIEELISCFLKDLFGFLFVAVFIVIGVGIYYHANLWPDHQGMWDGDWTKWRIWQIIYYPYFQLYGELFNDFLEGKDLSDCSHNTSVWQSDSSIERCPQEDWTVLGVSAIYMLFSNLLLVNLVIAMFSYTFERVQENSEKLWRFERYTVISDYEWRIPSPINIIFLPYRFCCCPGRKGCCLEECKICCDPDKADKKEKKKDEAMTFRRNFQRITAFRILNKL